MIVEPDIVATDIVATSKKHLLTQIAAAIAQHLKADGCTSVSILETMLEREKIGSTAIGDGVAIPHVRLPCLDGCISAFVRLETPINFGAADGQDVDLIYVFLAPEKPTARTASLMHLARISHFFRDHKFCDVLRDSDDVADMIQFRNQQMLKAA